MTYTVRAKSTPAPMTKKTTYSPVLHFPRSSQHFTSLASRLILAKSGSPRLLLVLSHTMQRRAKDGHLAVSTRTRTLDSHPHPAPRPPNPRRLADHAAGSALRPRPTHCHQLAARRGCATTLRRLLLLSGQLGTQVPSPGQQPPAAGPATAAAGGNGTPPPGTHA